MTPAGEVVREDRRVALISGLGAGHEITTAAIIAALTGVGVGPPLVLSVSDEMDDLDGLLRVMPSQSSPHRRSPRGRVIGAMFNGLSGTVEHIDTPKPVSKRRARRLRGRARAALGVVA